MKKCLTEFFYYCFTVCAETNRHLRLRQGSVLFLDCLPQILHPLVPELRNLLNGAPSAWAFSHSQAAMALFVVIVMVDVPYVHSFSSPAIKKQS